MDRYCVAGGGTMRIGYPTRRLFRTHPSRFVVRRARSRALIALTTSRRVLIKRLRVGSETRTVRRRLHGERRHRIGRNTWYLASGRGARLAFKTRGGRVLELGIADERLTRSRRSVKSLLRAWHL
jgi:hypothetical protein